MIRRILQRAARLPFPYGRVRHVWRGPMRGMRYVVAPGMGATYALGADALHARFLAARVRRGDTVYDVGANRGQSALLFSRLVGPDGHVACFEPVPALAEALRANLRLNALASVEVHASALGEREGRATFELADDHPTQGKLTDVEPTYRVPGAEYVDVGVTTLDAFVASGAKPPTLLKLDVEGGAGAVLRGGRRVLRETRPHVFVELHGPQEQAAIRDELLSIGYRAHSVHGVHVADPTARWTSPLYCTPHGA